MNITEAVLHYPAKLKGFTTKVAHDVDSNCYQILFTDKKNASGEGFCSNGKCSPPSMFHVISVTCEEDCVQAFTIV